jgi:pimeloyl-ACP methyl ester carboxylesterase
MPSVSSNGVNIHYEVRGSGEPLLLIMGITAPGSVWEKHVAAWEGDFSCILVDNRGVGQSDIPPGPYTSLQMAEDCVAVLDHLGLAAAHVAGVSMGSIIAQQIAIHYPTKVKSLVLMCPWARCDHMAKTIFEHMVTCKQKFTAAEFSRYIQLLIFSKSTWDNNYSSMVEDQQKALLDPNPQTLEGLQGQAAACIGHNALDHLPSISCPTLVLGGTADQFTPQWMTEEVASSIPGSELVLYPGAGHAFHWECLEEFNATVLKWLLSKIS